jgi:hypothetical protein
LVPAVTVTLSEAAPEARATTVASGSPKCSVRLSVATPLEFVVDPFEPLVSVPEFVSKRTRIPDRGLPSESSTTAVMFDRPDWPGVRRRLADWRRC